MQHQYQPPAARQQKKSRRERSSAQPLDTLIYGRVPPQAKELEVVVLGALMLERSAMERVQDILTPECFYVEAHQDVYRAALTLHAKHSPIDILTMVEELKAMGKLEAVGGPYAVTKLTNTVTSAVHIEGHAQIIQQLYLRREIIRAAMEMIDSGYDEEIPTKELIEESERNILRIGTSFTSGKVITMNDALMVALERIEKYRLQDSPITGVYSGYPALDRATRGWQEGDLIILAARPSVGKTAYALNLIRNAALHPEHPVNVAVWSLEMDFVQLVLRMLAAESKTLLHKIQTGRLSDEEMNLIRVEAAGSLSRAGIFFDDNPNASFASFRAQARRLKKKHNIGLIVIDYLQLMSGEGKGNREQEISNISRGLKMLAKELNIPIIALSQLSREVEKRTGAKAKPQLSDLRESGAIEQDADLVIFLWGPTEEEVNQNADLQGRRYVRIAKARNGVLITEEFDFRNEIQLFQAIDAITSDDPQKKSSWVPMELALAAEKPNDNQLRNELEDLPF